MLSHSFLPNSFPHRNSQMEELASILAISLRGGRPSNVFIYGKPGTGKTCVTRFVLKALNNKIQSDSKRLGLNFFFSYLNCKEVGGTNYSIYQSIIRSIDNTQNIPSTGLPTGEVYQRLVMTLNKARNINSMFIIILDEVDELVKKSGSEVLYNLTRINDSLSNSQVSLIGISNDTKFKDYLDPRVYSSLSEEEIVFTPYNAKELIDILFERARGALFENVIEEGVIQKIAAIAAREHGDARRALDLLRVSSELAERKGNKKIYMDLVSEAKNHIEKNTVQEVIKTLPLQSKVVISAIYQLEEHDKLDEITSGSIYDRYAELCDQTKIDKVSSRRVSDYINELDVLGILEANVISKGRYGRTKKVKFCVPKLIVRDIIANDAYLERTIQNRFRDIS